MRWRVAACAALLACASLSAQATRAVTFAWEMLEDDPGAQAEIERDGVAQWCQVQFSGQTRSCTLTMPVGAGVYRARMATIDGAWGPWSEAATFTIPPVTPGSPPGPFTIRLHRFSEATSVAATVGQSAGDFDGSGSATSIAEPFSSVVTAGSTLIAFINIYNASPNVSSVTDTQGNTWARVTGATLTSAGDPNFRIETWRAVNAAAGSTTVTANFSSGMYTGVAFIEVTGAGAVIDANAARVTAAAGAISGAAITPSGNGLHLAAYGYENVGTTSSPGTGWTQVIEVDEANNAGAVLVASRTAVSGAAQTPTWNHSASGPAIIVHIVVADASGGGGASILRQMLQQHH